MLCRVCGAPVAIVVHEAAAAPAGYCAAHAPVRLSLGDSPARAALAEAGAAANPEAAGALYDLAAVRLRAGRVGEAVRLARRASEAPDPDGWLALELLSEALEHAGDAAGAEDAVRRAIATGRGDGETHARLGRLVAARGDLDGAVAAFEAGFAADPWSFECCRRAAVVRIARGAPERGLAAVEGYLEATRARAAEVIPVAPTVGPEAVPGAPRPATVGAFPSELAWRAALRRSGGRRAHVVAAARCQARILAGDALRALGRFAEAAASYGAADGEIAGVSPVLLREAGLDLG